MTGCPPDEFRPQLPGPIGRLWLACWDVLRVGLGSIGLAVLFYGVVAPFGLCVRLAGKDPLRLRHDRAATTYWMRRHPPGPAPETMTRQR
jgi:hypothetical protein